METVNQLTVPEFKSLVKSWIIEAFHELQHNKNTSTGESDKFLTVNEAGDFLGLVPVTIYSKVAKGELKAFKRGKRLYFSRKSLVEYIQNQQRPFETERG